PVRYLRAPGAVGRDRASPSVCRSARVAAGEADGASDRFAKARGRVRLSQRHAPHTPPPPAHGAYRCRQEADLRSRSRNKLNQIRVGLWRTVLHLVQFIAALTMSPSVVQLPARADATSPSRQQAPPIAPTSTASRRQ